MTISVTKDGRTKLTGKHYTAFRYELWMAQNRKCIECGRVTDIQAELHRDDSFHTDHLNGRGLGGSKRDDTFKSCVGKLWALSSDLARPTAGISEPIAMVKKKLDYSAIL